MKPILLSLCLMSIASICLAQGSTGSKAVQSYGSSGSSYAVASYGSSGSSVAMKAGGSTGYAASTYGSYSSGMSYAELARHLRVDHGVNTRGMSYDELVAKHNEKHAMEGQQARRRGLFGWRR